ncbi:hypothetical protein ACO22_07944, partial [Paracoccidioides brasiliensis]
YKTNGVGVRAIVGIANRKYGRELKSHSNAAPTKPPSHSPPQSQAGVQPGTSHQPPDMHVCTGSMHVRSMIGL